MYLSAFRRTFSYFNIFHSVCEIVFHVNQTLLGSKESYELYDGNLVLAIFKLLSNSSTSMIYLS